MNKGSEFSTSSITIPPNSTATTLSFTKSWRQKDPPPDGGSDCNIEGWWKKTVNDVVFCAVGTAKTIFDQYPTHINRIADQVVYLRGQTGYPDVVKYILLVEKFDWDIPPDAPPTMKGESRAVANSDLGRFVIPRSRFYWNPESLVETATHETGHLVDWLDGVDVINNGKPDHFKFSYDTSFIWANHLAVVSGTISGYLAKDPAELYAEIFTSLFFKYNPPNFVFREEINYVTTNFMLDKILYTPLSYSMELSQPIPADETYPDSWFDANPTEKDPGIQLGTGTIGHNALIYIVKAVAESNNLQSPFPGTVQTKAGEERAIPYNDIYFGKFMPVGVFSLRLKDHAGQTMGNTNIVVSGATKTTRLKKDFNVFSDGSGDFLDINGTAVILETPVGTNKIVDIPAMPSYYQGAGWLGQKTDIIQGSNPVINLGFKQHFDPIKPNPMPVGSTLSDTSKMISKTITGRIVTPLVKSAENMKRYPDLGGPANAPTPFFVVGGSGERDEEHTLNLKWGTMGTYTIKNTFINMTSIADQDDQRAYGPVNKTCTRDYSKPGGKNLYGQIAPYTATPAGCY